MVSATVSGTVKVGSMPVNEIVNVALTCPSEVSKGKNVSLTAQTTIQGVFKFSFQTLAQFNQTINCTLSMAETKDL